MDYRFNMTYIVKKAVLILTGQPSYPTNPQEKMRL